MKFAAPAGEGYGSGEDDDEEEKPTTLAEAAMDEALQEEDDTKRKLTAYLVGRPVARALTKEDDRARWRNRYIALGDWCYALTMGDGFNQFITLTIGVAIILVGCQTYPTLQNNPTVTKLDSIVLDIFIAECVLKFVSESTDPLKYLTGPRGWWNALDVSIVILCMPTLPVGSSGAILRLARLSRIGKVVEKVPKLRVLLSEYCCRRRYRRRLAAAPLGPPAATHPPPTCALTTRRRFSRSPSTPVGIAGGFHNIVYIGMLLGLCFYIYGCVGVLLFRASDPLHFGSLGVTFKTLFQITTMESVRCCLAGRACRGPPPTPGQAS
jgi:hypothetical protein